MLTTYLSPPVAPPSPPTPKVSDWTKSTVDLEWIPPLKDGGSKIVGYWVEYKEEGTEAWVKVRGNQSQNSKSSLVQEYNLVIEIDLY